ncbi:ABC transporter substrate-binding protein [Anaeroselena agilis]|uniref:ABC transporter substrate-binding protein n=1 Tax=Anaeroselena agilis TaxID=3063788 RepID=A0ABU3NTN5_9FIRM|nr:ABC transporter substrate-binding protein [Selenomonadales bacterium 4137-cl]
MRTQRHIWFVLLVALSLALAGCGQEQAMPAPVTKPGDRIVTDMAGRDVALPAKVKKVYAVSPVETVLLYTLAPDLQAGWSYHMAGRENLFILPEYRDLPVLGAWTAFSGTASVEEILKIKPDLILLAKPIGPAARTLADEIHQLTKLPVFVVDGSLTGMEQAYLYAGRALGREDRAARLAAYCRETLAMVRDKKPLLAGRKPVTVYYAEGAKGLETEPSGSWHAEIIEYVGGVNVAGVDVPKGGNIGRSPVSLEQLLLWDPELILISYFHDSENSSFPQIMGAAGWRDIRAVQSRRVYEIPHYPFNWFDRPPSVNRLIGIKWVANLLYPDVYPLDLRAEVKKFYALFYHYQLSEEETDRLLRRSQR